MMVPGGHVFHPKRYYFVPCSVRGSRFMRAARVANFPRSYKFIVPCSVRGVGVDGRRGRWLVYITSTPPRRAGSCLFFCLSRCVPAYLCMSVPIYILYIYRAIQVTGEILGCLFPGLLICVCHGRGLIPSRPGGGKLPPKTEFIF